MMAIEPSWRPPFYSRMIVSREVQAPVFGLGRLCIIRTPYLLKECRPDIVCAKCSLQSLMCMRGFVELVAM